MRKDHGLQELRKYDSYTQWYVVRDSLIPQIIVLLILVLSSFLFQAIICVTDTQHLANIFGFPANKEKRPLTQHAPLEFKENDLSQKAAVHRIRYLLNALAKDKCDNKVSFPTQLKIKVTSNGKKFIQENREAPNKVMTVKISCNGKTFPKTLSGLLPLPRKPPISVGLLELEKNNDLALCLIGRPGKRSPCIRCQVYHNSMLTCRLTMSHSNPDFDFFENFKGLGGVDGLLSSFYAPRQGGESEVMDIEEEAGEGIAIPSDDPTENLKKAEVSMQLASYLHKQAEILVDAPVTLGKDFVKMYFPVDPTDGHYVYCVVCGRSGNLLCCDGCPTVVHADCIGLTNIPEEDWFCQDCCTKSKEKSPGESDNKAAPGDQADESGSAGNEDKTPDASLVPMPPKSPYPAYFQFANLRRAEIKAQHPDKSNGEITKMLSSMWKESSEDFKQSYFKEEAKQREAYKLEMEQYKEKLRGRTQRTKSSSYDSAIDFIRRTAAAAAAAAKQEKEQASSGSIKDKTSSGMDSLATATAASPKRGEKEATPEADAPSNEQHEKEKQNISNESEDENATEQAVSAETSSKSDNPPPTDLSKEKEADKPGEVSETNTDGAIEKDVSQEESDEEEDIEAPVKPYPAYCKYPPFLSVH